MIKIRYYSITMMLLNIGGPHEIKIIVRIVTHQRKKLLETTTALYRHLLFVFARCIAFHKISSVIL